MFDRSIIAAVGAAVGAIALAVMSVKFAGAPPTSLDQRIQRILERGSSRGRSIGRILSGPGYPGFYFPATALLILALRRQGARGSEALIIASVGGWAIHRFIKLFAHRRRPHSMTGRSNELQAFPSGHTSATTAIALTAAHVLAKQHLVPLPIAILIAVAIPLTIGLGRVLSDEHWATDVIGGWIGGAAIAALAVTIFERA